MGKINLPFIYLLPKDYFYEDEYKFNEAFKIKHALIGYRIGISLDSKRKLNKSKEWQLDYTNRKIKFIRNLKNFRYYIRNHKLKGEGIRSYYLVRVIAEGFFGFDIKKSAIEAHEHVIHNLMNILPEYRFVPLKKDEEYQEVLNPFEVKYVSNIKKRHYIISVKNPKNLFFIKNENVSKSMLSRFNVENISKSIDLNNVYCVSPFKPPDHGLSDILMLIDNLEQNLIYSLEIKDLSFPEKRCHLWPAAVIYNTIKDYLNKNKSEKRINKELNILFKYYKNLFNQEIGSDKDAYISLYSDEKIQASFLSKIGDRLTLPAERFSGYIGGYEILSAKINEKKRKKKDLSINIKDSTEEIFTDCSGIRSIFYPEELEPALQLPLI